MYSNKTGHKENTNQLKVGANYKIILYYLQGDKKVSVHLMILWGAMKTQCIRTISTQLMI
jgi:hypothetical protein